MNYSYSVVINHSAIDYYTQQVVGAIVNTSVEKYLCVNDNGLYYFQLLHDASMEM